MLNFNGSSLKEDKIKFNYGKTVNIYIVYALKSTIKDITLENCLLGAVKITKMMILVSTNIQDMVLDLMEKELFLSLVMDLVTTQ